jgi:LmbE family N-acetylglucosaminyl deacetylase
MMVQRLKIEENANILIIAPHPDDETIGVGGILALHASQCDVLVLTDGRKGVSPLVQRTEKQLIAIRKTEFQKAADNWGVRSYSFLDIPDRKVTKYKRKIQSLNFSKYDYIFLPYRYDAHPDHKAVYKIVNRMMKRQNRNAKLIEYEIWTPLKEATYFIDITDSLNRKISNTMLYQSQLESYDYVKLCRGIAEYRGALCGHPFCETYFYELESQKQHFSEWKMQLYHNMVVHLWSGLPLTYKNKIRRLLRVKRGK